MYNRITDFLLTFYRDSIGSGQKKFIFTGPLDAFSTRLKIATYGGIVLALPVWLWELWRFITPGLNPKEKRYAVPFVLSSIVLFAMGAVVALLTLQPALHFLLNIGGSAQQPLLTDDKYILAGLADDPGVRCRFEFPIVLVFLLIAHVLTTDQLRRWRRYAMWGSSTFAAVITPSQDPYSLFLLAGPMYLFYEASIVIGRILKR